MCDFQAIMVFGKHKVWYVNDKQFHTLKEASEHTGIPKSTLHKRCHAGRMGKREGYGYRMTHNHPKFKIKDELWNKNGN